MAPITLGPLTFGQPLAFLLLLLIPFILLAARGRLRRVRPPRRALLLTLRAALLGALVVSLADPSLLQADDRRSFLLVLDASESAGGEAAARARLAEALAAARPDDRVAAVAFGEGARVLRPWAAAGAESATQPPPDLAAPPGGASDLEAGLHLAAGLAAAEPSAEWILVSDGWSTTREPGLPAGSLDLPEGAPFAVLPITPTVAGPEVAVAAIEGPGDPLNGRVVSRAEETLETTALIESTEAQQATLRVALDDRSAGSLAVDLQPGLNRVPLEQQVAATPNGAGAHRLSVSIDAPTDTRADNNRAEAALIVHPQGQVLVLEERDGEAADLARSLAQSNLAVEVRSPGELGDLASIARYDAVVLANVAATSFTLDQQKTLQAYVADRGGGLIVAGSRTSFALGGYLDTPLEAALPLDADVPPRREAVSYGLVLVLDQSGSMEAAVDGVKKIRMAAEAGVLATESLRPEDYIGVLAFESGFNWLVPVQRADENGGIAAVQQQIAGLSADGGTQMFPAAREALTATKQLPVESKHVILMTDGRSWGRDDWETLMAEYQAEGVVLSAVALGSDSDRELLARIAQLGQGRFYYTERVRDLPRLITKEATVARQSPVVEGTVRPRLTSSSPILRTIAPSELPDLQGYIAATPKSQAEIVLATDQGDPLLAQWHYGLGRAVAWTGGLQAEWVADWLTWERANDFWGQTVRWAMPAPGRPDFEPRATVDGNRVTLRVDALAGSDGSTVQGFSTGDSMEATILDPNGRRVTLTLPRTAPGRYETTAEIAAPGAYRVEVTEPAGGQARRAEWTGFAVHPDPEYAHLSVNEDFLRRVAIENGGRIITDLSAAWEAPTEPRGQEPLPLWPMPLALAVVLLPLDIAARRFLS